VFCASAAAARALLGAATSDPAAAPLATRAATKAGGAAALLTIFTRTPEARGANTTALLARNVAKSPRARGGAPPSASPAPSGAKTARSVSGATARHSPLVASSLRKMESEAPRAT
jgi:hypothetical protein